MSSQVQGLIDEIHLASAAGSAVRVRVQLDEAVLGLGLGGCIDEVVLPALRGIGLDWQRGRLSIGHERLTSEVIRGWLEERTREAPVPHDTAVLLLACGPRDRHSIGLEALGLLLRQAGQPCRVLGARTPVRSLQIAAAANRPRGIVVVSHLGPNRLGATQALHAVDGLGAELFYAGGAFDTERRRQQVPGTYLGTNIQAACRAILAATAPTS